MLHLRQGGVSASGTYRRTIVEGNLAIQSFCSTYDDALGCDISVQRESIDCGRDTCEVPA
jgi:hypothetical protein